MLKSLTLGNKTFPINIIQGPLAGVSCAPFRSLTWQYGKPAFSCTEMISCKTLLYQPKLSYQRYLVKDPQEGPVCFQLASSDVVELAEAVKIVTDQGADLIDLNCGCPVKKIRSKGAGSSLLMNPTKLYHMITAMKQNTTVPVSVKIRIDGNSLDKFNQEIANVVSDAGADFLIVHGRHWTERYDIGCNYEQIQFFVEQLKIPVIGNGDIACVNSLRKMLATGCAGVMIARAGVGQPWLIQQLIAELDNRTFTVPNLEKIKTIFLDHVKRLAILLNSEKLAVVQARKFAKYYARNVSNRINFCIEMNACKDLLMLAHIATKYFV